MTKPVDSLTYPCPKLELNRRTPVIEGIDAVRMSVPWALNHVNCWLITEPGEGVDSYTLIDTGIDTDNTRKVWGEVLGSRAPYRTLITHYHPDHSGLVGWFHELGSTCVSHATEIEVMHHIWATSSEDYVDEFSTWYLAHGLDQSHIKPLSHIGHGYRATVAELPNAELWQTLKQNDNIELGERVFRVLEGQGHAPAMIMLFCEADNVLIAADQVLPRISPNVSVLPGAPDQNPLASFLDTLEGLKNLPEETLVLPSHGDPFLGLHERVQYLLDHHQMRLDQLRAFCVKPVQAADVLSTLFERKLDAQQLSFALGEALAHLRYLVHLGELSESTDASGTRFHPAR